MPAVVLDSSAVLAFALAEVGRDVVQAALLGAAVCAVNHTEIVTRMIDKGWSVEMIDAFLELFPYDVVPYGRDLARSAALLRTATRPFGLALGDRACLALAQCRGLPAYTTDRHWAALDIGVEIRLIR